MKEERLKELLEKYYNGETSLEEERILSELFCGDETIPGYEAEKEIFRHYGEMTIIPAPADDLEKKIMDSIDGYEMKRKQTLRRVRLYSSISIAAAIALFAVFYFFLKQKAEPRDTFSDPRIAYTETVRVLNEVSLKLNRGMEELKPVALISSSARASLRSVKRSASMLKTNLKPMNVVNKLSEVNDGIIKNNNK